MTKCKHPNCTENAVPRNVYCPDHLREMSKRFNDAGLQLQPVSQWRETPPVQRKRGIDYRGSVK